MAEIEQDKPQPERQPEPQPSNSGLALFIVVILASLASIGAYFLYWQQAPEKAEPIQAEVQIDTDKQAPELGTDTTATIPEQEDQPELQDPLPSLADSDEFLRQHWPEQGLPANTEAWLQSDFILQRGVSFIDGLANGTLLRKFMPSSMSSTLRPKSIFQVSNDNGAMWLDQANYDRYSGFTATLLSLEPEKLAALFHWLRPLLESAYGELGEPAEQFGNRLITGIDLLLTTPEIAPPIKLKRESVYYQYADPVLEALPDSQKLLLRMGPDNRATIKQWLTSLKAALVVEN